MNKSLTQKLGKANIDLLKVIYKENLEEIYQKLENNYPIQYLIGNVDFYNINLKVNEDVLIPRFETELLVEKAIKFLKNKNYCNLIDIGTGSGAIAIALKNNLKIEIDAIDISNKALTIAKENALNNNVKINFIKMDILKEIPTKKYDCIISNPPYIAIDEYTSPETKYEPNIALYAKNKGLEFYERILSTAKDYLNIKGSIIFEIGAYQANDLKKIAFKYFPNAQIKIIKDYNNLDRFFFLEN